MKKKTIKESEADKRAGQIAEYQNGISEKKRIEREEVLRRREPRLISCRHCGMISFITNSNYKFGDPVRPGDVDLLPGVFNQGHRVDKTCISGVTCPQCDEPIITESGSVRFVK